MITLRLYLENISADWFGWIEDHPGVLAQGTTPQEVERLTPQAFHDYLLWLQSHGELAPAHMNGAASADFTTVLVETLPHPADAPWNSCHRLPEDARPMRDSDFDRYLRLLRHARTDLSNVVHAIPPHEWDTAPLGEQSIRALLQHIVQCDTCMLERIGVEPTLRQHPDPWITLIRARSTFESAVQDLVTQPGGSKPRSANELWTLARVLRLAIWNERRVARRISARFNPAVYLRPAARGEAVVRLRETVERPARSSPEADDRLTLARHTHRSDYYY